MHQNNCYHPFHGVDIFNDGSLQPCCKFRKELFPNWQTHNIKDGIKNYLESPAVKELQRMFISGEKPDACVRCWKDEEAGLKSKRQMDFANYNNQNLGNGIKFIGLPLGNLCNLKCRICSPKTSSSLIKEYQDLFGEKVKHYNWYKDKKIWNEVIEMSKGSVELEISGGEPFLYENTEHLSLIKALVESNNAKNIKLHYTTNGTVRPVDYLFDAWNNFKFVEIQVSIDDYGKRFEYNRYPAIWEVSKENLLFYNGYIKKKDNMKCSISTTVSAFTIYYLDEFFLEIAKLRLPKPWLGRLHFPNHYRPSIFPLKIKEEIKEKLLQSRFTDVKNAASWLDVDDTRYWENFLTMVKMYDQYRGQKFEEIFFELSKIIHKDMKK